MAKALTQQDLMIWTMTHASGTKTYYVIEKEPFLTEGLKKAPHRIGSTGDAVFKYRDQAEAELARYPEGGSPDPAADGDGTADEGADEAAASESTAP